MLFHTLGYAIFLPIVFFIYWFIAKNSLRLQNLFLLLASYYFYGAWDKRFLILLLFSTALDFYFGRQIASASNQNFKKFWLYISVVINLGFLGVFKYYNFFVGSFADFINSFGVTIEARTLSIILPVGISFYTFHGLSYVFDLYRAKIKPEESFTTYALFVSFFPLLVAGPIERAGHLLPQLKQLRLFNESIATEGLKQILWGLFKKIVIADTFGKIADSSFANEIPNNPFHLWLGVFAFAIQIYGDFSGYSDMAIGSGKIFGIQLLQNFNYPYFSRSIAEFWKRWHISLSTWFRDYLYIPLGGNQNGKVHQIRNVFLVFIISGLWHGANWTFILWGTLHALYFLPSIFISKCNDNKAPIIQSLKLLQLKQGFYMLMTFMLVTIAWVLFRSPNINYAFNYYNNMFSLTSWSIVDSLYDIKLAIVFAVFIICEWVGRHDSFAIQTIFNTRFRLLRYGFYYFLIFCSLYFVSNQKQFIYFQF